jgi:hypothetical protein
MHPVLKHLIDTDFADLDGSKLEGQIVLTDELINAGITNVLVQLMRSPSPADTAPASPPKSSAAVEDSPDIDVSGLLQKVTLSHIRYRTEAGKTILELKAEL